MHSKSYLFLFHSNYKYCIPIIFSFLSCFSWHTQFSSPYNKMVRPMLLQTIIFTSVDQVSFLTIETLLQSATNPQFHISATHPIIQPFHFGICFLWIKKIYSKLSHNQIFLSGQVKSKYLACTPPAWHKIILHINGAHYHLFYCFQLQFCQAPSQAHLTTNLLIVCSFSFAIFSLYTGVVSSSMHTYYTRHTITT